MQDIVDVIEVYTGRCRTVLEYSLVMGKMVGAAKQPGFSADSWGELEDLVNTGDFVRVGNFKEVQSWAEYLGFLTAWAAHAEWECSFKRISEADGVVFLELEERSKMGDFANAVNSLSVYEFDEAGKIVHIDIYLQMALSDLQGFGAFGEAASQ